MTEGLTTLRSSRGQKVSLCAALRRVYTQLFKRTQDLISVSDLSSAFKLFRKPKKWALIMSSFHLLQLQSATLFAGKKKKLDRCKTDGNRLLFRLDGSFFSVGDLRWDKVGPQMLSCQVTDPSLINY